MRCGVTLPQERRERREVGSAWCREPDQQLDPGCSWARSSVAPVGKHVDQTLQERAPRSAVRRRRRNGMEVLYPRCCGVDVRKREVVVCALISGSDGMPSKTIRAFGTMTP